MKNKNNTPTQQDIRKSFMKKHTNNETHTQTTINKEDQDEEKPQDTHRPTDNKVVKVNRKQTLTQKPVLKNKNKTNLKLSSDFNPKKNTFFKQISKEGTAGAAGLISSSNSNKFKCSTLTNPKGPDGKTSRQDLETF